MDEDVVFGIFEPLEDEGPVVIVFLPMLEHLSATPKHQCAKPAHKTQKSIKQFGNWSTYKQEDHQIAKFKPQAKSFFTLQASMEVKFEERQSAEG